MWGATNHSSASDNRGYGLRENNSYCSNHFSRDLLSLLFQSRCARHQRTNTVGVLDNGEPSFIPCGGQKWYKHGPMHTAAACLSLCYAPYRSDWQGNPAEGMEMLFRSPDRKPCAETGRGKVHKGRRQRGTSWMLSGSTTRLAGEGKGDGLWCVKQKQSVQQRPFLRLV